MADETFGIIVEVDPRKALDGQAQVDRGFERNEGSAREFEAEAKRALAEVAKAAKQAAKEQEAASRAAAKAQGAAAKQAARDVEENARAMIIAAERRAKEREAQERRVAAAAKQSAAQQKAAHDQIAAAYKAIVGPAAEYNQKLAQAVQLERQGAISAQQRAQYVRGLQREISQYNAKQQGGFRGAIGEIASSQLGAVAGPAAAAATAITAGRKLIEYGDQYATLTDKIRASTASEAEAIRVREKLFKTANDARVPVEALTALYAQARIATKDLGTSQGELIRVSELLSKATRGVGEANRSAGLQQFGQALTKGKLQAEELMSIMENIPKVGVLLAEGMGMTVGELRKAAEAGKVGTQEMLDAIEKMGPAIEREFAKSAGTSAESWAVFKNEVLQTVGGFAEQINLTGILTDVLGQVGVALKGIGEQVRFTVDGWKALNSATDGWLGKLVTAPGLLGSVSKLAGQIAGQYLFGAEMLERQASWAAKMTREAEKQTGELEKQLTALSNSTVFTGYSRGADGRATGYGILGNYLRDSVDASNNPTRYRIDKQEERDAAKASRDHAAAVRETAAAWKEWLGEVKDNGANVLDRVALQVGAVRDRVVEGTEAAIAAAEATRVANENMVAFATTLGGDLLDTLTEAGGMLVEFSDTTTEVNDRMSEAAEMMTQQLGGAIGQTVDALIEMNATGKSAFGDLVRSMLVDIEKLIARMLIFQGLKSVFGFGTGAGSFGGVLAGALGLGGFTGFAGGGTVVAGGSGGVDSVPFSARVSPGERITFTPPGREPRNGNAPPTQVNTKVVLVHDAHAAALEAMRSDGDHVTIEHIARNAAAVRAALR